MNTFWGISHLRDLLKGAISQLIILYVEDHTSCIHVTCQQFWRTLDGYGGIVVALSGVIIYLVVISQDNFCGK